MDLDLAIRGGDVLTDGVFVAGAEVGIRSTAIAAVGSSLGPAAREVDASGLYVLPGFVDVHVHGAGGFSHPADMAEWLPRTGVTAFLPTLAASAPEETLELVAEVAALGPEVLDRAEVLGSHLEGPFLQPEWCGAQPRQALRKPSIEEVEQLLAQARGTLRRMTLAPELPGAEAVCRRLAAAGVQVSLGHSSCSYAQALEAVGWGASSVTHEFNAMAPFHHREPGLVGAALTDERLLAELIADGVHVTPAAALLLVRARGAAGVALITDGLPALGLPPGEYDWMGRRIATDGRVARLADGTLAGSTTSMLEAVRNLVDWGVPLAEVACMASRTGAILAGASQRKGLIAPGYDADLVLLDKRLELVATSCRGQLSWSAGPP